MKLLGRRRSLVLARAIHKSHCFIISTLLLCMISTTSRALSGRPRIAVVGGGASGIFAAVAAHHQATKIMNGNVQVVVLEATSKTLTKVAISGGGRCNVLHDTSKPLDDILSGYPRGSKELTGLMTKRFSPAQAKEWFTSRGVTLKTESDGRMFPTTDSSQTIIDVLMGSAQQGGVEIRKREKVLRMDRSNDMFVIRTKQKSQEDELSEMYDAVILATGSSPSGHELARGLGLKLVKPVPSLFTLSTRQQVQEGGLLNGLSGLSVPHARLTFRVPPATGKKKKKKKTLQQEGPLLITHHGVSGPAALRLSSFGARDFASVHYQGDVLVHWAPALGNTEEMFDALWRTTQAFPKRSVATVCPLILPSTGKSAIPKRLWASFCQQSGIPSDTVWGQASKKQVRALALMISECALHVTGRGVFKEEFVTAGGVSLKEIDMRTMQSKSCPGLFLCGELIDVDGVTGGFNFMNCWSTGYVAGCSAAEYVLDKRKAE